MPLDPENAIVDLEVTLEAEAPLPAAITEATLRSLICFALSEEQVAGRWAIALLFTTDAGIQAMHRAFMNLDSPTDIMTFPYESDAFSPLEAEHDGGDIAISVETAATNAGEAGWSLADELQFLVLHGLLHLLGWDDLEAGERVAMLARQTEILERWRD